jgi:hypothetical protein
MRSSVRAFLNFAVADAASVVLAVDISVPESTVSVPFPENHVTLGRIT